MFLNNFDFQRALLDSIRNSCDVYFMHSPISHLSFSFSFYVEPGHLRPKRKCCIFRLKSAVRSSLILRAFWNFVCQLLFYFIDVYIYVLSDVSGCFCFLVPHIAAHRRMKSVVLAGRWIKLDQLLNLTQIWFRPIYLTVERGEGEKVQKSAKMMMNSTLLMLRLIRLVNPGKYTVVC